MSSKRFKDQILTQILESCNGDGVSKTKVVYSSGLNFKTIVPYLSLLINNGLLEVLDGHLPLYKTTEKGFKALAHLKGLEDLIPEFKSAAK
jgi:predicted transcriptional regulator